MKAYYLLAPLSAALIAGCAYERTVYTTPAPVAVAPTYVAPPSTVVLGAGAVIDTDRDGWGDAVDRYPFDARFH